MEKKLRLDENNAKLVGVCSGIGKYFNIDPTTIRLLFVLFTMAGGSGIMLYVLAALVMKA